MMAAMRFLSPEVKGLFSSASFLPLLTNWRWSFLNGFFPALPKKRWLEINQMASANRKMAHRRNTKLKLNPNVTGRMAINVVPMNDPIFTNEYWIEKALLSSSLSSNSSPFTPDRFPLKSPVPMDTSMIIIHTRNIESALQVHR